MTKQKQYTPPPSSVEILLRQTLWLNLTMLKLFRSSLEDIDEQESVSLSGDFLSEMISVFFGFFLTGNGFGDVSLVISMSAGAEMALTEGSSLGC